ncbi:MAG: hypothetical protein V3S24_05810, partial [Candidatus Tectomicrobia bacterium]
MTSRLLHFIRLLREHGVRISVAESLDALHSVGCIGIQERELLRLSLRTALVKSQQDFATFDTLFERFFTLPRRRKRRRARHKRGAEEGAGQRPASQANGQLMRPHPQSIPTRPTASPAAVQPPPQEERHPETNDEAQTQAFDALNELEQAWRQQLEARPLRLPSAQANDLAEAQLRTRIDREFP